jgi:hypothetical protein
MVALRASPYTGLAPGLLTATLRTFWADTYDVFALTLHQISGIDLSRSRRAAGYALICEEPGALTETQNAELERRLRKQLVDDESGPERSRIPAKDLFAPKKPLPAILS